MKIQESEFTDDLVDFVNADLGANNLIWLSKMNAGVTFASTLNAYKSTAKNRYAVGILRGGYTGCIQKIYRSKATGKVHCVSAISGQVKRYVEFPLFDLQRVMSEEHEHMVTNDFNKIFDEWTGDNTDYSAAIEEVTEVKTPKSKVYNDLELWGSW